jgi:hypothetical protein
MTTSYYYFVNDRTKVVYYSEDFSDDPDLIYVGTSDNPKPKMAVAAFMQSGRVNSGYKVRKL